MCDDDINIILKKLDDLGFDIYENDNTINSNNQPSLWILGKKYKMLSGNLIRAYECWKDLVSEYYPLQNKFQKIVGYNPISVILDALSLQTQLFEFVNQKNIKYRKINSIVIPHINKIIEWDAIITKWKNNLHHDFYTMNKISIGDITWYSSNTEKLIFMEIYDEQFYKFCFCDIKDKLILIPPHSIFLVLKHIFSETIKNNFVKFEQFISKNTEQRIHNKLLMFENEIQIIPKFSINNSLIFDFGLVFDSDKLFLIKIVSNDFTDKTLQDQINIFNDELIRIKESINDNTIGFVNSSKISGMLINKFELIPVFIIKTYDDTYSLNMDRKKYSKNGLLWYGTLVDFLSLMSFTKNFMDFLIFLRQDSALLLDSTVTSMNSLDRYAYYEMNNKTYFHVGTVNNIIEFEIQQWEKYLITQLKKLPDYQPRLFPNEPDDFWNIHLINNKIIEVYNPQIEHVARIFFAGEYIIWIHSMFKLQDCTANECSVILFLIDLIPYRITQNDSLQKLLNTIDIQNKKIHFRLSSIDTMLRKNIMIEKTDFLVRRIKSSGDLIVFDIIYSSNFILNLFKNNRLDAEKEIIRRIINGLVNHFCKTSQSDDLVDKCMDELFASSHIAFNLSLSKNPLQTHPFLDLSYVDPLIAHLYMENQKTAHFLSKRSFKPEKYYGNDAKYILDEISNIKLMEFDQIVSQYDVQDLVPFILDNYGKLIESRYALNLETKTNLKLIMEFDPKPKYDEKSNDVGVASITTRYILERIVAICPSGKKKMTKEKWYELQAIIISLLRDTLDRNMIHYNTGDILFQINTDYSYRVKYIDIERIKKHTRNVEYEIFESDNFLITLNNSEILSMIEKPFCDEFGVTFSNFHKILVCCMKYVAIQNNSTMIVSENMLINHIKKTEKNIPNTEISSGLMLSSLTKNELNKDSIFVTDTKNRKNRLLVKPIISLKNSKYVINTYSTHHALFTWVGFILKGYLPFKHDFKNPILRKSLNNIQHMVSKNLENNIVNIVKKYTSIYFNNIKSDHQCFVNLKNFPGEIDILALFPKKKIILLIEIKSVNRNVSSLDISKEIKKYKINYEKKLLLKKSFIIKNQNKIISYCNMDQLKNWKIEALFVTDRHQFDIPDISFQIIPANDLDEFLKKIISE